MKAVMCSWCLSSRLLPTWTYFRRKNAKYCLDVLMARQHVQCLTVKYCVQPLYYIAAVVTWSDLRRQATPFLSMNVEPFEVNPCSRRNRSHQFVCLTFMHHESYIKDRRTATPHTTIFIYLVNINLYAPRILYIGQTYRYSTEYSFYIFSQH